MSTVVRKLCKRLDHISTIVCAGHDYFRFMWKLTCVWLIAASDATKRAVSDK